MRTALAVIVAAAVAVAQEAPRTTVVEAKPVYQFSFEQGWKLDVALGSPRTIVTSQELSAGLGQPLLLTPGMAGGAPGGSPVPVDAGRGQSDVQRTQVSRTGGVPPGMRLVLNANGSISVVRNAADPLKVEGHLTKEKEGYRLVLDRMEYWNMTDYWRVTFGATIEARDNTKEGWKGTPEEWAVRMEKIEAFGLALYVKAGAPTETGLRMGLDQEQQPDAAKRLYVLAAIEEHLVGLLLMRMNGGIIEKGWAAAVAKRYPDSVVESARQILARLVAQCKGDLAPTAARSQADRSLKDAKWTFGAPEVPAFTWTQDGEWMTLRDRRIVLARHRLAEAIERSQRWGILSVDWEELVQRELKAINVDGAVPKVVEEPTVKDVLAPRMFEKGKATYDFTEKLSRKDGEVRSSRAEVRGHVKGQVVAFYDGVAHRWRVGELQYETWFASKVDRNLR